MTGMQDAEDEHALVINLLNYSIFVISDHKILYTFFTEFMI